LAIPPIPPFVIDPVRTHKREIGTDQQIKNVAPARFVWWGISYFVRGASGSPFSSAISSMKHPTKI